MKMKESSLSIICGEDESKTLRLSGLLSEWLFASGFWSEVNSACGTMFDQYEEDDASPEVLSVIQRKVDQKVSDLRIAVAPTVEFVHGWTADRTPIKAIAKTRELIDELVEVRNFLQEAILKNSSAYFSL